MKTNTELREAWARLSSADSYVLACHQRPDGDTLGSALALARVLRGMGKEVVVLSEDGVPENYNFIPDADTVLTSTPRRDFGMGVLVDSEGISRVGSAAEAVLSAKDTACVDHHEPDNRFGNIRIVDPEYAATAELVAELLEAGCIAIDREVATQLLTGVIADTGAFRFSNTSPRTFHVAARLTDIGADPSTIARKVYDSRPLHAVKLLGRALSTLRTDPEGKIVWAVISRSDMDDLGAEDADTDSVVNHVRSVRGPEVAILFREIQPNVVRISLRSEGGVDVNRIARVFDGGGHAAAAGCTIEDSLENAQTRMVNEVLKWMES